MTRSVLGCLVLLLTVLLGGSPLLGEQAEAACRPSVALTFSNETKTGGETISATVTITANAATGGAPDTLTQVALTGVRNAEVRIGGQPVAIPASYTLPSPTAWSFESGSRRPAPRQPSS